jgi:TetR/AcrR family transcriptional regulator, transcriptional repressor for nem operon
MKVSREQMGENRRRILDAAVRLFRARGLQEVTVAEVMAAAGLTHGGFYGHFRSKDDLIAKALAHALSDGPAELELGRYADAYLTPGHRDDRAGGCAVAALGGETGRQSAEARSAMTAGLRRQIARLTAGGDPAQPEAERRQAAIGGWAALVGAMVLARACDDPELSTEVLDATRSWIGQTRLRPGAPGDGADRATTRCDSSDGR